MLAWLDAGSDELRTERVEIDELIGGLAAIGKPLAEAHGLSFRVRLSGSLTVRTDPDKVREVMMNLIHNAIEYNRPGGEVEVIAAPDERGGRPGSSRYRNRDVAGNPGQDLREILPRRSFTAGHGSSCWAWFGNRQGIRRSTRWAADGGQQGRSWKPISDRASQCHLGERHKMAYQPEA